MYQLKLERHLHFLLDDSNNVFGWLSPESNLEVKKPVESKSPNLLATVILVPLYAEAILRKHKGKLGTVLNPRLGISAA
jgi:hypothetical protein